MTPANRNFKEAAVVILAAGNSQRMGKDKALLRFNETRNFAEQLIFTYLESGIENIFIVGNKSVCEYFNNVSSEQQIVKTIHNPLPHLERFYSIKLGIEASPNSKYIYIQPVDQPFANKELLLQLWKSRNDKGYAKPVLNGKGGHPILLGKPVIDGLMQYTNNTGHFKAFLQTYPCNALSWETSEILSNIDTPEEYKKHFG